MSTTEPSKAGKLGNDLLMAAAFGALVIGVIETCKNGSAPQDYQMTPAFILTLPAGCLKGLGVFHESKKSLIASSIFAIASVGFSGHAIFSTSLRDNDQMDEIGLMVQPEQYSLPADTLDYKFG